MPDPDERPAVEIARKLDAAYAISLSLDYGSTHPASDGRMLNGGIMVHPTYESPTVKIRPPNCSDNTFCIRAENYEDAQYIADAVYYYIGLEPSHFWDASFQFPPLRIGTRTLLCREMCSVYVEAIARGPARQKQREEYRDHVEAQVLKAVKSREAVLFLSGFRPEARPVANPEAKEDGRIAVYGNEAATRGLAYIASFGIDPFDSGNIQRCEGQSLGGGCSRLGGNAEKHKNHRLEAFLNALDKDELNEYGQSVRAEEVNSDISVDTASRHEYQQNPGDTSLGNDQQCELLTFPDLGEVDAVTITERDMESHQCTMSLKRMDIPNLSQRLRICLEGKAISGGCIEHVQNNGTSMSDAQGAESKQAVHVSAGEVAPESQQQPEGSARKRSRTPISATLSPPRKLNVCRACVVSSEPPMEQNNCKKWTDQETSKLLFAMVGGRFCKGKRGGMRWEGISIVDAEGRRRSKTQCQNRSDVLKKAYKTMKDYMDETGKPFSEITEKERRDMKLATPLSEVWYKDLDNIYCRRRADDAKSRKRAKLNSSVGSGPLSSSPRNSA